MAIVKPKKKKKKKEINIRQCKKFVTGSYYVRIVKNTRYGEISVLASLFSFFLLIPVYYAILASTSNSAGGFDDEPNKSPEKVTPFSEI